MALNTKTITYALVAAVTTGIATSQSGSSITLNGSLVSGGVATLDSGGAARRVIVSSGGNDTAITFLIKGTNYAGVAQSEVLPGASGAAAQSVKDYKTVTSITPSGAVATYITAGTNGVGSSPPIVLDWVPNGNLIGCSALLTGTANYTIQEALDDFSPAWDMTVNNPNWFNDANFASVSASAHYNLAGPFTLARVLVNSGTGTVQAKFVTPFIGGAI